MRISVHPSATPAPGRNSNRAARLLLHGCLALVMASAGGVLLVWPQWMDAEGSRTAVEIQRERENGLQDRLDMVRAMNGRLRAAHDDSRKLFRIEQVHQFPALIRELAKAAGAEVAEARVTAAPTPGRRASSLEPEAPGGEETTEIKPMRVQIVLTGSFESVYRTVGALCRQDQLVIPDRWQLTPRTGPGTDGKAVKAQLAATVFVIRTRTEEPRVMPAAQMAAALPLESRP